MDDLSERLKMEAQIHAQEARTANATIAEIYRLCTDGAGEPGNWHGAEPVRRKIESLRAECESLRASAKRVDEQLSRILHEMAGSVSLCWEPKPTSVFDSSRAIEFVTAAIQELRAIAAMNAPEPKDE